jgi:hypothetical protein
MARKATARKQSDGSSQLAIADHEDEAAPRSKQLAKKQAEKATKLRTTKPQPMYRLTVRITEEMDARLTAANEQYGLGPQPIVHEAINDYADALGIPRDLPIPSAEERPQRPAPPPQDRRSRSPKGVRREEPPKIGTRITPLTDTRLTALCELTGDGPQQVLNTALNIWMNRKRIRGSGTDSA